MIYKGSSCYKKKKRRRKHSLNRKVSSRVRVAYLYISSVACTCHVSLFYMCIQIYVTPGPVNGLSIFIALRIYILYGGICNAPSTFARSVVFFGINVFTIDFAAQRRGEKRSGSGGGRCFGRPDFTTQRYRVTEGKWNRQVTKERTCRST